MLTEDPLVSLERFKKEVTDPQPPLLPLPLEETPSPLSPTGDAPVLRSPPFPLTPPLQPRTIALAPLTPPTPNPKPCPPIPPQENLPHPNPKPHTLNPNPKP